MQEFSKFRVADVYEYVWTQNKAISGVRVEEMEGKFGMLKQTAESGQMPGTYMQAVTITDKARLEEYLASVEKNITNSKIKQRPIFPF